MCIQVALMQTIKTMNTKKTILENKKNSRVDQIEALQKAAETRVLVLETELGQMR
jgi:hypothetical protein